MRSPSFSRSSSSATRMISPRRIAAIASSIDAAWQPLIVGCDPDLRWVLVLAGMTTHQGGDLRCGNSEPLVHDDAVPVGRIEEVEGFSGTGCPKFNEDGLEENLGSQRMPRTGSEHQWHGYDAGEAIRRKEVEEQLQQSRVARFVGWTREDHKVARANGGNKRLHTLTTPAEETVFQLCDINDEWVDGWVVLLRQHLGRVQGSRRGLRVSDHGCDVHTHGKVPNGRSTSSTCSTTHLRTMFGVPR